MKSAVLDDAVTPASNALLVPTDWKGMPRNFGSNIINERAIYGKGKSTLLMTTGANGTTGASTTG